MTMSILVMKKQPDKKLIEEVALVMELSPAYVEKDWYITQRIRLEFFGSYNVNSCYLFNENH